MLSLCMITQDEEECVKRAIDSVDFFVDEIIIIDGGSRDATCEIVSAYNKVNLFIIPFNPLQGDSFAVQKNNAIERANGEWILFLDADEYYNSYIGGAINFLIDSEKNKQCSGDAYAFSRKTIIDGRLINILDQDWQFRLFRNYCRYLGDIDEKLVGYSSPIFCNLDIIHDKKNEWQQRDNEMRWDMGQEPPKGWKKIEGVWTWTGDS